MHDVAMHHAPSCDVIIASAAPADYRPAQIATQKIKKQGTQNLALDLVPTPDIIAAVGTQKRAGQIIIAFAAETENLTHEARRKMQAKNADAIIANDITQEGAGFEVSTNRVTWITQNDEETWPLLSKKEVAARILDKVVTTFLRGSTL